MRSLCRGCTRPAVRNGYCERCGRIPTVASQRPRRRSTSPRKRAYALSNDTTWRELSKRILEEHPFCARCQLHTDARRFTPATVTDHIIPVRVDPERVYDETNLQTLCVRCHGHKTGWERRGVAFDYVRQLQIELPAA